MLHMLHGVIRAMQQSISLSGMFTLCIQEFCCDLFVFVYRLVLAEHTCAVAQGLSGKYVFFSPQCCFAIAACVQFRCQHVHQRVACSQKRSDGALFVLF